MAPGDVPRGAGWLADPTQRFARRYFDGANWTDYVANEPGRSLVDPFEPERSVGGPRPKRRASPWMLIAGGAVVGIVAAVVVIAKLADSDTGPPEAAVIEAPASTTTEPPFRPTADCVDAVIVAVDTAEIRTQVEGQQFAPVLENARALCDSAQDFAASVERAGANRQGLLPITVVRIECSQSPSAQGCDGLAPPGSVELATGGALLCDGLDIYLAGLQLDLPFEGTEMQQDLTDLEADARRGLEDNVVFTAPEPIALAIIDAAEVAEDRDGFAVAIDAAYEVCVEYGYSRPTF